MGARRTLVVGGGGYLGTAICARLAHQGDQLVSLSSRKATVEQSWTTIQWDYGALPHALIHGEFFPQAVIFLAGQTSASRANVDPVADIEAVLKPMVRLLEWVARRKQEEPPVAVVYAGSVTQIGFTQEAGRTRPFRSAPDTIYDLHKQSCEDYLNYYTRHRNLDGVTLRLCNVYGPGVVRENHERGVVNQWASGALQGKPLAVFGSGNYIRDFIYIDDVVEAFLAACGHAHSLRGGAYEIGTGRGITIIEAARQVSSLARRLSGRRVPVQQVAEPIELLQIDRRNFVADPAPFHEITGWRANVRLEHGLEMLYFALMGHPNVGAAS